MPAVTRRLIIWATVDLVSRPFELSHSQWRCSAYGVHGPEIPNKVLNGFGSEWEYSALPALPKTYNSRC